MSRGAFWAWVLIVAGLILLAQELGLVAVSFGALFWPSMMILWGVHRLGRTWQPRKQLPAGPKPAAALASGDNADLHIPIEPDCYKGEIQLSPGAAHLTLQPGRDDGNLLIGNVNTPYNRHQEQRGSTQRLHLSAKRSHPGKWDFWLHPTLPLKLKLVLGSGTTRLDLTPLTVTQLTIDRSNGRCVALLPDNGDTVIKVEGGPGDLTLISAPAAAVTINAPDSVRLKRDEARFPGRDGFYQSPSWNHAASQIWIDIVAGAGTIEIR